MSGWIIVDTKATNERDECGTDWRYLGRNSWRCTIAAAGTFATREDAVVEAHAENIYDEPYVRIRRVRPAGTKRDAAAAQAAEDNVATLRTELEGLRATDEEMAALLAAVTAERDAAVRDLAELRRAIDVLIARVAT